MARMFGVSPPTVSRIVAAHIAGQDDGLHVERNTPPRPCAEPRDTAGRRLAFWCDIVLSTVWWISRWRTLWAHKNLRPYGWPFVTFLSRSAGLNALGIASQRADSFICYAFLETERDRQPGDNGRLFRATGPGIKADQSDLDQGERPADAGGNRLLVFGSHCWAAFARGHAPVRPRFVSAP